MLEVIALIVLCIQNGKLATRKGLKAATWIIYTVLAWIGAEMIGVTFGLVLFGQANLIGLMLLGLVSGFGGYLFIKSLLDKIPDTYEKKDIDRVGVDDLQPPKK